VITGLITTFGTIVMKILWVYKNSFVN